MGRPIMLKAEEALLLVIDIQKCFEKAIPDFDLVVKASSFAIRGFKALKIPVLVSEQNPAKLGETVEPLREALGEDYLPFSKFSFSLLKDKAIKEKIEFFERSSLILIGIEAHVCLLQTALDALAEGYKVFVLSDCVSSRFPFLKELALGRMKQEGAIISSLEIALFELLQTAEHPNFKEIQLLIKENSKICNYPK